MNNNGLLKTLFGRGKTSWLFLLFSFLSIFVFSIGATFCVVDDTTYVSTAISYYEKKTGYTRVYAEAYGTRTDINGYYHFSDFSFAFSQKAASTINYSEIKNRYFYVGKGSSSSTYLASTPNGNVACTVMLPAVYEAKGSYFGFSQFGDQEIRFTDDSTNKNTIFISEKLASDILGQTVTKDNYSQLVGKTLEHSIDGGGTFDSSHTILGVITENSLGAYAPILGDYFVFAPYCSIYSYYRYLHMAFFFGNDRIENESSLNSCIFDSSAKAVGIQCHFFNYSEDPSTYTLGELDKGIQSELSTLPTLKKGLLIGGCVLIAVSLGLETLALIFEKRLLSAVASEIVSDQRNVLLTLLMTTTVLLAIVLSFFALIRFSFPPSFFLPFAPLSMVAILVFFLAELFAQSFLCHHSLFNQQDNEIQKPNHAHKNSKIKPTVIDI